MIAAIISMASFVVAFVLGFVFFCLSDDKQRMIPLMLCQKSLRREIDSSEYCYFPEDDSFRGIPTDEKFQNIEAEMQTLVPFIAVFCMMGCVALVYFIRSDIIKS